MLASSSKHVFNLSARTVLARCSAEYTPVRGVAIMTSHIVNASELIRRPRVQLKPRRIRPATQTLELGQTGRYRFRRGASTTEYNLVMRDHLVRGEIDKIIELAEKMKGTKISPDVTTYNILIAAVALDYKPMEAWAIYKEMLVMGLEPDVETFNELLFSCRNQNGNFMHQVLGVMEKKGVQPNGRTFETFISFYLDCDNLEMALVKWAEMNDADFFPNLKVAQSLIATAGRLGHPRLALELATMYEETTIRRLDTDVWVNVLICCAEQLYADGVQFCWKKVVEDLHVQIDEGLCQLVLHTAGRHGLPELASEAIRHLEFIGTKFEEHHFTPMLDAFVTNKRLKEAFCVLDLMRSANVLPNVDSAYSILQVIRHDPELIDNAYSILEELHKEGKRVDVVAVNVLIKSCGLLSDLPRAIGIYKALPSLAVEPDPVTFENLLKACRSTRHIELGDRLFAEMRESNVKPTARTYEAYISLILTQVDYENAFYYLEEMKVAGFTPTYPLYDEIVRTCISNDDGRYKLAVQELEQMGYTVSPRLERFIETGGKEWPEVITEDEKLPYNHRKSRR